MEAVAADRRREANASWFAAEAGRLARLCGAMAERFARGGRLLAVAGTSQGWSDAHHGGQIAADGLADHVVITRSQHIPRIQEAQAGAYHVLCELVR